jgi:surfactin synthase thioesterase subunit
LIGNNIINNYTAWFKRLYKRFAFFGEDIGAFSWELCLIVESRLHIQTHLDFAAMQSPNKKPKELEFLPPQGQKIVTLKHKRRI